MSKEKERLPYRLSPILEFLIQETRSTDTELEKVIALINDLQKRGDLPSDVGSQLLVILVPAMVRRSRVNHVLTLLYESGIEVALREVERVQAKRRKPTHGVKSK